MNRQQLVRVIKKELSKTLTHLAKPKRRTVRGKGNRQSKISVFNPPGARYRYEIVHRGNHMYGQMFEGTELKAEIGLTPADLNGIEWQARLRQERYRAPVVIH